MHARTQPAANGKPKVALAHHWLLVMRGGERVLEQFCLMFPDAPIYTLFHRSKKLNGEVTRHPTYQSWLGRLPYVEKYYRDLLPLFPLALETLRVPSEYDFVLSCDASIVKGLAVAEGSKHCCYCCSPPRYLFDLQKQYLETMGDRTGLKQKLVDLITPHLQRYDIRAANKVDSFLTLSAFAQERITRTYAKDSYVIEPPVDVDQFAISAQHDSFYLIVSALVPYKKIDLAIQACNRLNRKLVVIGDGPEMGRLRSIAGPTVTLLGSQGFQTLKKAYADCRAFLFPGIEDFGITALEAQASGKPVIAIRKGAVIETVIEGSTGVFFDEQNVDSMVAAIVAFEKASAHFDPRAARANAERYRPEEFRRKMKEYLAKTYPSLFAAYPWPL